MLKLESVSKYYRSKTSVVQALRRVSLTLESGEFVVITGESGSGKSTLLNVISGLDTYEEGEFYIHGEESSYYSTADWERYRRQMIGNVFQDYNIIDALSALQNVEAVLAVQGWGLKARKARALAILERVGLAKQARQKSSTLSGGEKQRVAIARALAKGSPIIVADEPTGNLDKESGQNIIRLLKEISQDKLVVMVTHDFAAVKAYATRRIRLFDGEVVEDRTLKPSKPGDTQPSPIHGSMTFFEKWRTAWRNLLTTPKRLVLQLLIAMTVVGIFSLAYGGYVQAEHTPRTGFHPLFTNLSPARLIVLKHDGAAFTAAELEDFAANAWVKTIIPFDPALELSAFVPGMRREHALMPFAVLTTSQLESGRFPETAHEIVIPSGTRYDIGETVPLQFGQYYGPMDIGDAGEHDFMFESTARGMTVTGIAKSTDRFLYVHPDFFADTYVQFQTLAYDVRANFNDDARDYEYVSLSLSETLAAGEIAVSGPAFSVDDTVSLRLLHPFSPDGAAGVELTVAHVLPDMGENMVGIVVNRATFETLFATETKQIALIVGDAFDADRVMTSLDEDIYASVYPAGYVDAYDLWAFARIWMMIGLTLLFGVMYFMAYVSLKAIIRARTKDYVIYRSIGASRSDLHYITIFEMLTVFFVGFMTVYAILALDTLFTGFLPDFLRYYTVGNYVFMTVLMLSIGLMTALRFNRKIFTESVITTLKAGAGE